MRTLLLIGLLFGSWNSGAVASDLVIIPVPPGFEGPQTSSPGPGAHMEAYVRRIPGKERGTLLQITTYDFGSRLAGIPKEELGNAAENYLMQMLGGVERRRGSFAASRPTRVSLGGLPAARVEWTGTAGGFDMSGVMFCVIVGTVVVTLHTQGFSDSPPADRTDALSAIEQVSFADG